MRHLGGPFYTISYYLGGKWRRLRGFKDRHYKTAFVDSSTGWYHSAEAIWVAGDCFGNYTCFYNLAIGATRWLNYTDKNWDLMGYQDKNYGAYTVRWFKFIL